MTTEEEARGLNISLLVPFKADKTPGRLEIWTWLEKYWKHVLPDAEIVVGSDLELESNPLLPFSKTCAMNDAFRRSHGDVVVLLDADCYIEPSVITECARRIRNARVEGEKMWFVPYRHLYRLTKAATKLCLDSDPTNAPKFSYPPNLSDVNSTLGCATGHWFGALIQIMPREAFELIGGMEPRCRGWGADDVINVRVLDTLYNIHRTSNNQVFTFLHPQIGDMLLRKWENQSKTGVNNALSVHYRQVYRDKVRMREVIKEWTSDPQYAKHLIT